MDHRCGIGPCAAFRPALRITVKQRAQRLGRIRGDTEVKRPEASNLGGVNIYLHDLGLWRYDRSASTSQEHSAPSAQQQDDIRPPSVDHLKDCEIAGRVAVQRMVRGHGAEAGLLIEDRDTTSLREGDQQFRGDLAADAAASDDRRPLGLSQQYERILHGGGRWRGWSRHSRAATIVYSLLVCRTEEHVYGKIDYHRTRCTGQRLADRKGHQTRNFLDH